MFDAKIVREQPELVKEKIATKGADPKIVDRWLKADVERRQHIEEVEGWRAERNKLGRDEIEKGRELKANIRKMEPALRALEEQCQELLMQIPNLPAEDVKAGKDESENEVIRTWGKKPKFSFEPKDHLTLGEELDLIDTKRAAKVSGARFTYLKNEAVLLEYALIQYGLEILLKEGFSPILPPAMTKVEVFHKLGYSQHGDNEEYYLVYDPNKETPQEGENYYLIGTAEHALVPYHAGEVLAADKLPLRYVGFSPAFRREAGSYGKDTKGILRLHQFDKLEMVSFTTPENDEKEHEYLLSLEEKIMQGLELPYQVVKMCTGDLGHPAARKYDIETWMPGQNKYRETHSCSTCTDYQARSLGIKYKKGGESAFAHVLNGTAIAIGRTLIAILENYQDEDGAIRVPKALQAYVGKAKITSAEA